MECICKLVCNDYEAVNYQLSQIISTLYCLGKITLYLPGLVASLSKPKKLDKLQAVRATLR